MTNKINQEKSFNFDKENIKNIDNDTNNVFIKKILITIFIL
jgi:hypothetical protein